MSMHNGLPAVFTMPAEIFCAHLLGGHKLANAAIDLIKRRKNHNGVQHEFLLMRARDAETGEFWIRIDRAAELRVTLYSVCSNFRAIDTVSWAVLRDPRLLTVFFKVQFGKSENELIKAGESAEKSSVSFVSEDASEIRLDLRRIACLLNIIQAVSPHYSLIKVCNSNIETAQSSSRDMPSGELFFPRLTGPRESDRPVQRLATRRTPHLGARTGVQCASGCARSRLYGVTVTQGIL